MAAKVTSDVVIKYRRMLAANKNKTIYYTQPSKHEALGQYWFDAGRAS